MGEVSEQPPEKKNTHTFRICIWYILPQNKFEKYKLFANTLNDETNKLFLPSPSLTLCTLEMTGERRRIKIKETGRHCWHKRLVFIH